MLCTLFSASKFLYDGHSQHGFCPVLPTPFMTPLFGGKYTASLHIDPEPPAAPCHKKGSQVLEPFGLAALDEWGDFGSQYNSGRDEDTVSEDDLPTLKELLRPTLPKDVSIEEPEKSEHTLQRAGQQAWTRLLDVGDSQGRCINSTQPQTKQLLTICRETTCS